MNFLQRFSGPNEQLRVAGLMSGKGSNLREIIKLEKELETRRGKSPFTVCCIFSDDTESNARIIGKDFDIPVVYRDVRAYYKARNKPITDIGVREEFDEGIVNVLDFYGAHAAAFAGYMRIATSKLTGPFICVNVHPGDLSVVGESGLRKYVGADAVSKAILAGEKQLRSSTILLESATTNGKIDPKKVDCGRIMMISEPLDVLLPADFNPDDSGLVKKVADENQDRLKQVGDLKIFPRTLQYIAEGRYAQGIKADLYFDGKPVPNGIRWEEVK